MRSEGQVRQRLKQVLYRNLQKRLKANFKRKPASCKHNRLPYHIQPDDPGSSKPSQCPRVCVHAERAGWVCDERHEGLDQARQCPLWEPFHTRDEVQAEFREAYADIMAKSRKGEKHPDFPVASALLWVLGDDFLEDPEIPEASVKTEIPEASAEMEDSETNLPEEDNALEIRSWRDHPLWPWNWFK